MLPIESEKAIKGYSVVRGLELKLMCPTHVIRVILNVT